MVIEFCYSHVCVHSDNKGDTNVQQHFIKLMNDIYRARLTIWDRLEEQVGEEGPGSRQTHPVVLLFGLVLSEASSKQAS